jgi:hypothetical protein
MAIQLQASVFLNVLQALLEIQLPINAFNKFVEMASKKARRNAMMEMYKTLMDAPPPALSKSFPTILAFKPTVIIV